MSEWAGRPGWAAPQVFSMQGFSSDFGSLRVVIVNRKRFDSRLESRALAVLVSNLASPCIKLANLPMLDAQMHFKRPGLILVG